jgi:hypothetical protein
MQPWRWLRADELGLGLSGVRHHRRHVEQLGDAVIGAGLGDHHPAVGVPAQDDRPLGGADRLAARVDVGVEIAELIAGFSAAGQRHRDASDSVVGEGLGHLSPPPLGVAHAGAVNEDQSRHRKARVVAGFSGELPPVTQTRGGSDDRAASLPTAV